MVHDFGSLRVCIHPMQIRCFNNKDMRKFHVEVDGRRPSCGLWLGSTVIAGGMLKKCKEGRCWDVVVCLFGYTFINANNNFIRVGRNLGPKVVLFNRLVRK